MQIRIIIAGFGGHGILSAGRLLAYAGMMEGMQISWLPSYGPEMRGGTANCHVILSDTPIGSPIIEEADILIAMALPALVKFGKIVREGGVIVADADMVHEDATAPGKQLFRVRATSVAGNKSYAYMILLGKLIRETGILKPGTIREALYHVLPPGKHHLIDEEMEILKKGIEDMSKA